jgi:hypothetical protein
VRDHPATALLAQPDGHTKAVVGIPPQLLLSPATQQSGREGHIGTRGDVERDDLERRPASATRRTGATSRGRPRCRAPRSAAARRTSGCRRSDGRARCRDLRREPPPPICDKRANRRLGCLLLGGHRHLLVIGNAAIVRLAVGPSGQSPSRSSSRTETVSPASFSDRSSHIGFDRQHVGAVAPGHEGTLEGMAVDRPADRLAVRSQAAVARDTTRTPLRLLPGSQVRKVQAVSR